MSYWGNRKPHFGMRCGIDWSHPLARGLVGCWLYNEQAGGPRSIVTQTPSTEVVSWAAYEEGAVTRSVSGNTGEIPGYKCINSSPIQPITIVSRVRVGPVSGSNNYWWHTSFTDGVMHSAARQLAGSDKVTISYNASWDQAACTTGIVAYKAYTFAGTYDQATWKLYMGGRLEASSNTTANTVRALGIYTRSTWSAGGNSAPWSVYQYILNRALSAAEVAWLYAEPYAMIEAPQPPVFYSIPAGGSSIAAISQYYARMRGAA